MQRISALFLLVAIGISTFTFKTHYCFNTDTGTRFHGDCEHEVKDAIKKGTLGSTNFFPAHYTCYDWVKNEISQSGKSVKLKIYSPDFFDIPAASSITTPALSGTDCITPEQQCRGVPLHLHYSLRGPPSV